MLADPSFRMTVVDVFNIRGRGIIVTGRIERGTLSAGDVTWIWRGGTCKRAVVMGV